MDRVGGCRRDQATTPAPRVRDQASRSNAADGVDHAPGTEPLGGTKQRLSTVEGNDASFKYEDLYLRGYEAVPEVRQGLGRYFGYYNEGRPHQALGYQTPGQVYRGRGEPRPG